jgi:arylsulfatase A-like enzyme
MSSKWHLTSLALLAAGNTVAEERPNIILFLVDDMGVMDTSLPFMTDDEGNVVRYPLNDWYRTPNMERMARQGIRFSTFYAQSVSSPTRASIMTGQNAARHRTTNYIYGASNNRTLFGPKEWNWKGMDKHTCTLPKVLQQSGYKTIHVGKAHFGPTDSEGANPLNLGFDVNIGGSDCGHPGSYYGEHGYGYIKGDKNFAVPGLKKYYKTDTFLTEALTIEANSEISKAVQEKSPFFLYMAHYAVHAPFHTDKRFLAHYADSDKSGSAKAFATLIEGMDKSLGDIMDHLEELGVAENTLVLFLGDNGSDSPLGNERGHSSSFPLRGKKGNEFEGGVRVPFIACWAKNAPSAPQQIKLPIPSGEIQQQMGTVIDIYPTLLDITGTEFPQKHIIDGTSLVKQLLGKKNKKRAERFLMHFPHAHRGKYFTTYREDNWKLIYHYNPETPETPSYELYNLKEDIGEEHDLANKEKKILTRMTKAMIKQLMHEQALFPIDAGGKTLFPKIKTD